MAFKDAIWKAIEINPSIQTVILAGRWPFLMTGLLPESGGSNRTWLIDDQTNASSTEENAAVLSRSLSRTISRLTSMKRKVIIIGSVPEPGFDVPMTVAMALYAGRKAPLVSQTLVKGRAAAADALLNELSGNLNSVRFISILEAFCGSSWCEIEHDGVPIYYDNNHLSYNGAVRVAADAIRIGAKTPPPQVLVP